jgi:transcriptional regulator with XRE-family HTH domain
MVLPSSVPLREELDMSTFHEKLKEYRERLGMMQSVLAERSGLTKSHLNRIEKGLRPPPQVETVVNMVEVLRLTPEEAEEFVQLAGYSSMALEAGRGLTYDAPELLPQRLPHTYDRLYTALSQLPPHVQEKCIDAFLTLIENLTIRGWQVTKTQTNGENDE